MSTQRVFGAFQGRAGTDKQLNLYDATPSGGGWSPGAQIVEDTGLQPALAEQWSITAFSVSLSALVGTVTTATATRFANLGKLYGGVVLDPLVSNSPATEPFPFAPFSGLPQDGSTIQNIWDGQTDPPFPAVASIASDGVTPEGANVIVTGSSNLASPITLGSGQRLGIGLWLTPMLGSNVNLYVFNAAYSILYETQT